MKISIILLALLFAPLAYSQNEISDSKALSLILANPVVEQQFVDHFFTSIRIQSMPWMPRIKSNITDGRRYTIWIESASNSNVHNPCQTSFGGDVYLLNDGTLETEVDPLSFQRKCQF